jgi:hypothetical protein
MKGEQLKLVDGGQSQRTFIYIKDAIEAVQRMIVSGFFMAFYETSSYFFMILSSSGKLSKCGGTGESRQSKWADLQRGQPQQ